MEKLNWIDELEKKTGDQSLIRERWEGKEKKYDNKGNLIFDGEYNKGVRHGKEFNSNGNIIFEGEYYDMIRFNGIGFEYYDDGKVKYECNYIHGEEKDKKYNKKAKIKRIIKDSNEINDEGIYKGREYDKNDNLIFEGEFIFEKKYKGKRKIYDNNNNFLFEIDYDINSPFQKKENLIQKYFSKGINGTKIEIIKIIDFENNVISEGEFDNEEIINGKQKFYKNLNIEEEIGRASCRERV